MCGLAGAILGQKRRRREELRVVAGVFTERLAMCETSGRDAAGVAVVRKDGSHKLFKRPCPASELVEDKLYHFGHDGAWPSNSEHQSGTFAGSVCPEARGAFGLAQARGCAMESLWTSPRLARTGCASYHGVCARCCEGGESAAPDAVLGCVAGCLWLSLEPIAKPRSTGVSPMPPSQAPRRFSRIAASTGETPVLREMFCKSLT